MSDIFVFSADEESNDYSTMGLVGALTPTSCVFTEEMNGESGLELTHPLDDFGRYTAIQRGNILVVSVPVRATPEIQDGAVITTIWKYQVKPLNQLSGKGQRTLYKKKTGSSKMKLMNAGDIATVVERSAVEGERWKARTKYGTGWINPDGFDLVSEEVTEDGVAEDSDSLWQVTDQYFRIYETTMTITDVKAKARHISYDLLYNLTDYESSQSVSLKAALTGILGSCYGEHGFTAYTNVADEWSGLSYVGQNPIEAILDPEKGLCALYGVTLVRNNYDLYLLKSPGSDRGIRIEYGKNLKGITFTSSEDDVITRILPVGETKDGERLYLSDTFANRCVDSPYISAYPVPHIAELKCENCKVGDSEEGGGKITVAIARARMAAQAQAKFDDHCDEPGITLSVEFIHLGDTEEYARFRGLERLFLCDYVTLKHPGLRYRDTDGSIRPMEMLRQVVRIQWDCLTDRLKSMEIGDVGSGLLSRIAIASWQLPSGIDGAKLLSGSVNSMQLANEAVAGGKLQPDSVSGMTLLDVSVSTAKIEDNAITYDKLSPEVQALLGSR